MGKQTNSWAELAFRCPCFYMSPCVKAGYTLLPPGNNRKILLFTHLNINTYKPTVRNQHWQSCLSCSCLMFLCLFCVWAHAVSVCVCHVLPLYHLPVSPGHALLFSPCLVLVCLTVFTWSLCALRLYIVFLPLVSLLVRFGVYMFLGLRVKLWSCASYFDLAQVIFDLLSCYIISLFSLVLVFWFCAFLSSFVFSFYLDLTLTLFLQFQFPFWILAFCF